MLSSLATITSGRLGAIIGASLALAFFTFLASGLLGLTWRVLRARQGLPAPPRIRWPATGAAFVTAFAGYLVAPAQWLIIERWISSSLLIAILLLLPSVIVARLAPAWMLRVEPTRAVFSRRGLLVLAVVACVGSIVATALVAHRMSVQRSLDREIAMADAELEPLRGILDLDSMLQAKKAYLNALIDYVVAVRRGLSPPIPTFIPPERRPTGKTLSSPTWRIFEQGRAIALRRAALDERNAAFARGTNLERHAADIEQEIRNLDEQIAELATLLPTLDAAPAREP